MINEKLFGSVHCSTDDLETIYTVDFMVNRKLIRVHENELEIYTAIGEKNIKISKEQLFEMIKAFGVVGLSHITGLGHP